VSKIQDGIHLTRSSDFSETMTHRDRRIFGFGGHIAISACQSLSQSLGDALFVLAMVENPGLAVGMSTLSVVVPVV